MALQNAFGDLNLETTQQSVKTAVETVATNSAGKATETTLQGVKSSVDGLATTAQGQSLETTQQALLAAATAIKSAAETIAGISDGINTMARNLEVLGNVRGLYSTLRVLFDTNSSLNSVTTVSTVSNQTSVGGFLANTQIPSLMNMNACCGNIGNVVVS